jgi:CarboxypepD_reg-like domain
MMIQKSYLLIILLLQSLVFYAQKSIKGVVIDSETKLEIPYASVGVLGKSIGTIADEQGSFVLRIDKNAISEEDVIIVSAIGYELSSYRMGNIKSSFFLSPKNKKTSRITVNSSHLQEQTIGRTSEKGIGAISFHNPKIDDKLGREIGVILNLKDTCFLNKVNFFIGQNEFEKVKLRLHVYQVVNNYPKDLIINEDILIELGKNQTGWIETDVSKYRLLLQNKVAITLQWIESEETDPDSELVTIPATVPTFPRNAVMRAKSQDYWTLVNATPSIYITVNAIGK